MSKKLPYGQSNFADMIESGYAYVDKTRYVELLENENLGINSLDATYSLATLVDVSIFAIIDEYDHFSNDLAAMDNAFYGKMVGKVGLVRDFYESLKIATSTVMRRIFITGIASVLESRGFKEFADFSYYSDYVCL